MSVYKPSTESRVYWYDFIFEGQRVRESAKTRSKTVAKAPRKPAGASWRRVTTASSGATAPSYSRSLRMTG